MNPQINFGEDVMSRINFASENPQNLVQIQKLLLMQLMIQLGYL